MKIVWKRGTGCEVAFVWKYHIGTVRETYEGWNAISMLPGVNADQGAYKTCMSACKKIERVTEKWFKDCEKT